MVCKHCGKPISDEGISFCPHCGSYLREEKTNVVLQSTLSEEDNKEFNKKHKVKKTIKRKFTKEDYLVYLVIMCLWLVALFMLLKATKDDYYFSESTEDTTINDVVDTNDNSNSDNSNNSDTNTSGTTTTEPTTPIITEPSNHISTNGITSITYNNKYLKKYNINSKEDVLSLIRSDSVNQKTSCYADVINVENDIINNYGITAVNLCEMDLDFAKELRDVVNYIYNHYPSSRNYLTNMSLANVSDGTYMAAFIPIFTFATNNNSSGYPMGIKTMIVLNAKYFLDANKINNSVTYGVNSGYFPKNATRSSTVAHEMGHYLSFVALLKHYNVDQITFVDSANSTLFYQIYDDFNEGNFSYQMVEEAYNTYKMSYGNDLSFDQFRGSISTYAMARNSEGGYIYDETIAEAFHDCYLNGDNAKIASKLIMSVLKGYLL